MWTSPRTYSSKWVTGFVDELLSLQAIVSNVVVSADGASALHLPQNLRLKGERANDSPGLKTVRSFKSTHTEFRAGFIQAKTGANRLPAKAARMETKSVAIYRAMRDSWMDQAGSGIANRLREITLMSSICPKASAASAMEAAETA